MIKNTTCPLSATTSVTPLKHCETPCQTQTTTKRKHVKQTETLDNYQKEELLKDDFVIKPALLKI